MHAHELSSWQHGHDFGTRAERHAERRTRWVVGLTFATMVVELAAGWLTGSMALMADAWHMASHVGALGMASFAYAYARRHAGDPRYTFGTGKIGALAGYSSASILGLVAVWMAWESFQRLFAPVTIHYSEAMAVAALGLVVNLVSAKLLDHDHDHGHGQSGHHAPAVHGPAGHSGEHVDHNLRAAYRHVLADALTSVLAIVALGGGMVFGWRFLDPLMGLVGAVVVGRWAWHLGRDSAQVLLDAEDHGETAARVRALIEAQPDHDVVDLHVWRIGPASRACIVSVVSHAPRPADHYRSLLAQVPSLDHLTVEVNRCSGPHCGVGTQV
jgi:cation diffusion facilitator family transporter